MSGFGGVNNHPGPCEELGVEHASEAIKRPEKTGQRSKFVSSPGKIKMKILVPSAATLTDSATTRASFAHAAAIVKMDDDGALAIPTSTIPGKDGTFSS